MTRAMARPRKTRADYEALPEDVRAELIDGELYLMAAPSVHHQRISRRICMLLHAHLERTGWGEVLYAPVDVHLLGRDIVQPDLLVVSKDRASIVGRDVFGPPDLAVEILSATHAERDLIVKRSVYAEAGIREYWIVEPDAGIQLLTLEDEWYAPWRWFTGAEPLASPTLGELDATAEAIVGR